MIITTCDGCGCRVGNIPDGGKPVAFVSNIEVIADYQTFKRSTQEQEHGDYCVKCFSRGTEAFKRALHGR
jgi:hypothetical protein